MQTDSPFDISKVERDPNLFVWFMTLVIAGMYAITLKNVQTVRQPGTLVLFTVLTIIHIILHWQLGRISTRPFRLLWYILIQGALALVISVFARNIGMNFALFMGLLGEAVGLFRLTRWGFLAAGYYLALLAINIIQLLGWAASRPLLLGIIPIAVFVVLFVTLYMRQNEAREQAQSLAAELETANRQLTEYAAQVEFLTIANERQRMARELHDTLSQGLAGLILQLEAVDAYMASSRPERARTIVKDAMERARATLAEARQAIDNLRHPAQLSLNESIHREADRFTTSTGINCDQEINLIPEIPEIITDAASRAVAEGLTNIARHAEAKQVKLRAVVHGQKNVLEIEICDNGVGFDPAAVGAGHFGLLGISERVRLAGGLFEVQSQVGKGTCLLIRFPLLEGSLE